MTARKNSKKRLKVEWVDKGKPVDLAISKGELKKTTYTVRVTNDINRPVRAYEACISRQRRKGLINYGAASIESKINGVTRVSFSYRTNKISENEEVVQARVRIKADGYLAGLSDYAPYKEKVSSCPLKTT